jgi:hypothetical protein
MNKYINTKTNKLENHYYLRTNMYIYIYNYICTLLKKRVSA